jgi:cytochrome c551/c552
MGAVDENAAKAIIERVGCPQCHAYVQKKTGPPMKNIHEKYKGDWECVVSRLTKNKTHKEEGVTDDMKGNEYKIVADYIATRAK